MSMMDILRSDDLGKTRLKKQGEERKLMVERWQETGLLDGIKDQFAKGSMALLYENEAEWLVKEADTNTTSQVGTYDTVLFPLVRRTFGRLLANNIVSVQPISLPSGLIFYLDARVKPVEGSWESATVYERHYDNAGYHDNKGTKTLYSGYNPSGVKVTLAANSASAVFNYSATNHMDSLASLFVQTTGGTAVDFSIDKQTWAQDLFSNDQVAITLKSASTSAQQYLIMWYEYATLEGAATTGAAEVKLLVTSTTVQAWSRKMKTQWTPEMAEDLAAYHGENAEAILTDLMSAELSAEIDREILRDLINGAAFQTTWDYNITHSPYSAYQTQKVHNQTLITKINQMSASIHKWTLGPGANWIVCSPEIGAVLDDLDNFKADDAGPDKEQFGIGIEKLGTIGSRYTVYKDAYFPSDTLLMGYKGVSFMETGYIYCPYVPFQFTPVIYSADDFTPHKGIRTRYATKFVNNRYYALVWCNGLSTF